MTQNVKLNVLVIESNPDVRNVFAALLEVWGCSVVGVAEYDELNDDAANPEFDVVIMEFWHTDGPERCLRLHHSANTRHALFIATITYDDGSLAVKAAICGFEHVLMKPIDLAVLLELLKARQSRRVIKRLSDERI